MCIYDARCSNKWDEVFPLLGLSMECCRSEGHRYLPVDWGQEVERGIEKENKLVGIMWRILEDM